MDNVPANMSSDGLGATVTMSGIQEDKSGAAFNNPFEMVPTTGKLFKQMSSTFLSVTANQGKFTYVILYYRVSRRTLYTLFVRYCVLIMNLLELKHHSYVNVCTEL